MAATLRHKTCVDQSRKKLSLTPIAKKFTSRTEECRPVAAWVEIGGEQSENGDAVQAAIEVEAKILKSVQEKDDKLKQFQETVRRRVREKEQQRLRGQLENSFYTVEDERLVMYASSRAAEEKLLLKDLCSDRVSDDPSIRHIDACQLSARRGKKPDKLTAHAFRVHVYTNKAKSDLLTKKNCANSDLPGGNWKQNQHHEDDADEAGEMTSSAEHSPCRIAVDGSPRRACRRLRVADNVERKVGESVPELYPGVVAELTRKRTQTQRAMYRRMFMDMEREQVKELRKRTTEQRKIKQIRGLAESGRLEAESRVHLVVTSQPTEPPPIVTVTSSPKPDLSLNEEQNREMEICLRELRVTLKEKMLLTGVTAPLLCSCGTDFWDTDPETCANNCVFYRNTNAYIKALQSVLASCA